MILHYYVKTPIAEIFTRIDGHDYIASPYSVNGNKIEREASNPKILRVTAENSYVLGDFVYTCFEKRGRNVALVMLSDAALSMTFGKEQHTITIEQLPPELVETARHFIARNKTAGFDVNPYCTQGARGDFQRGFDNKAPAFKFGIFCKMWQLGRATALILEKNEKVTT